MSGRRRETFDVVVLGGGAGGMAAAAVAASEGLKVCLTEKTDRVGGTTAWSGGMVWAPNSQVAKEAGYEDTREAVRSYLAGLIPGAERDARLLRYLDAAPAAVDYLHRHTAVQLRPVPRYPDYYQDVAGATTAGRVLEPEPFDATALGAHLELLRRPLPELALFGDMMIARPDVGHFRNVYKSLRSLRRVAGLLAAYAAQKLRHGRGTTLVLGNALAARLLKSLIERDVAIRTRTSPSELKVEGGRVVGVSVESEGEACDLHARVGVVLATGGFSHDADRRARLLPAAAAVHSATAEGATGDGARLAEAAGAHFRDCEQDNAFWAPVSHLRRADGTWASFPHTVTDRGKPGVIAVNLEGRRFVNEAVSYHEFVRGMLRAHNEADSIAAYLVCDRDFLWRYGLGAVKPMMLRLTPFLDQGYLLEARTIEGLAEKAGIDAHALRSTVETYNRHAVQGEDPAFGKGGDAYQRHQGDASVAPNPCIAPIKRPPFYAVRIVPGDLGTAAGLATDGDGRVLNRNGDAIAGLYACGNDMCSVLHGAYPGPGITLGPALTFGYLAAKHMAGSATGDRATRSDEVTR